MEVLGVDGSIILKCIFQEVGCNCMGWFVPAQKRYRWRAYKAMNLRFPQIVGDFVSGRGTISFSGKTWLDVLSSVGDSDVISML